MVATARYKVEIKVRIHGHCDTLLQIEGFNDEDAREFILKYFRSRVIRAVIERPSTGVRSSYLQMRTRRSLHASGRCREELVAEFACFCWALHGTGIKTDMDAGFLAVNPTSNYEKI